MKKPLEILNLPINATPQEIKTRYRELALKHHPDRNPTCTKEAKIEHEIEFQKISEAYDKAINGKTYDYDYYNLDEEDVFFMWKDIWDKFVEEDGIGKIKDMLKDTLNIVRGFKGNEEKEQEQNLNEYEEENPPLRLRIYVTLEDIHYYKTKRVKVVENQEYHVSVNCGDYPYAYIPDKNIVVKICIKKHATFTLDSFMSNKDLYCNIPITLTQYLEGKPITKILKYIDNTDIIVEIPPFSIDYPISIKDYGLHNTDTLYVMPTLILPKSQLEVTEFMFELVNKK